MLQRCVLVGLLLLSLNAGAVDLVVGQPAPALQAKLLDSATLVQVGAGSGKVTIVNFWATWCVPCRTEMPALQAYYDRHKAQGLQVLAISMDEPRELATVRRIAQSYSFSVALKTDADFKGLGRIWRLPSTFVVDRTGILRKDGHVGAPTVDLETLEALVTPLLTPP